MDLSRLKRTSIAQRKSLVGEDRLSKPPKPPASFMEFWNALPGYLKAEDLRAVAQAIVNARHAGKPVIFMMGAHVIKVGLSPWLIDALEKGTVTALATNGAAIVHDFELAHCGSTSEDVAEALVDGSFGMTLETGKTLNEWIVAGHADGEGLGALVGKRIDESDMPHKQNSVFAAAWRHKRPATVHVALGADVLHHHPEASGEAIGGASLRDFHSLCDIVATLGDGGVALNVGSNVILPEVFLKALTTARNITGPIHDFTTANFDMIQHYRPNTNVVKRPVIGGGRGYSITGHHEIMLPLLLTAINEMI